MRVISFAMTILYALTNSALALSCHVYPDLETRIQDFTGDAAFSGRMTYRADFGARKVRWPSASEPYDPFADVSLFVVRVEHVFKGDTGLIGRDVVVVEAAWCDGCDEPGSSDLTRQLWPKLTKVSGGHPMVFTVTRIWKGDLVLGGPGRTSLHKPPDFLATNCSITDMPPAAP